MALAQNISEFALPRENERVIVPGAIRDLSAFAALHVLWLCRLRFCLLDRSARFSVSS